MKALVVFALVAACNGFDPIPQPVASSHPFANAGTGSSYPPGAIVTLDGRQSFDPDGRSMTYRWSVAHSPSGSTAMPVDPTAVVTTFLPDIMGTYLLELEVTDTALAMDSSEIRIVATGAITGVDAGPDRALKWLATAQLAGTVTTFPGQVASYAWRFVAQPADSTATLQASSTLHPTFVADAVGTYTVALHAAVGDEVVEDTASIEVTSTAIVLPAIPAQYAYSKRFDRLVYADRFNGFVNEVDATTGTTASLPLGTVTGQSIAIDPTGTYIGVGGPGRVVTYTVSPFAGYQIQNVPGCTAKQISIPVSGTIDCFPVDGTVEPISRVDMMSGAVTTVPCPVKSPVVALSTDGYLFMADEASPQIYEYNEFVSLPVMDVVAHGSLAGITPPLAIFDQFPDRAITGNGFIVDGTASLVADLHTAVSAAATSTMNNELATASGNRVSVFGTDAAFTPKLSGVIPAIHGMTPTAKFLAYSADEHRMLLVATSPVGDVLYTVPR